MKTEIEALLKAKDDLIELYKNLVAAHEQKDRCNDEIIAGQNRQIALFKETIKIISADLPESTKKLLTPDFFPSETITPN